MANYDTVMRQWVNLESEKFNDHINSSIGRRIIDSSLTYAPKVAQVLYYFVLFKLFEACRSSYGWPAGVIMIK